MAPQDTEFPGVVARPMGEFTTKASYHYQTLRCNVDLLKIIQLGITLFSMDGDIPPAQPIETSNLTQTNRLPGYQGNLVMCPCTWQFNFEFSTDADMYNSDSISMLKKQGADFEKHATAGIDPVEFGSLLITSGLALSDDVTWLSFHSGYDFAYLIKLMWAQPLPMDEEQYRKLVKIFFPNLYDVKFILRQAQRFLMNPSQRAQVSQAGVGIISSLGTKSGLQDLADELGCQRTGTQHTAGSDAWLTGQVFWQMRNKIFDGQLPEDMNGQMWGLTGVGAPASATSQAAVLAQAQNQAQGQVQGTNGQQNSMSQGNMMGFHTGATPTLHRGEPSTPTGQQASLHVGQSGTPNPGPGGPYGAHTQHHGQGGGGHGGGQQHPSMQQHGGVFGQFQHPQGPK
ncbi:ribonuclease H-like protein [Rhizodiscina lignyota]|uniref:poly(A)-specific ribonuclease n=1 Tax=Rhizodiscina lignyota TaxID=1504668 RepID=A0A9P4M1X5_9PEZI|nr:ribonuclease H-like protein [Rhizodiscina lignyota]